MSDPAETVTSLQMTTLRRLSQLVSREGCAMTASEVAGAHDSTEAGGAPARLKTLEKKGLVERLGVGPRNAATWLPTPAGADLLQRTFGAKRADRAALGLEDEE